MKIKSAEIVNFPGSIIKDDILQVLDFKVCKVFLSDGNSKLMNIWADFYDTSSSNAR